MSVVEKALPRRMIIGVVIVVVAIVLLATVVALRGDGTPSSSVPSSSTRPATTASARVVPNLRTEPIRVDFDPGASYRVYLTRTEAPATVRVFAFIDLQRGELRFVPDNPRIFGTVVGRVADRLVLQSGRLSVIDEDFSIAPIPIGGDDFVGSRGAHAIAAEYFPERTTFHEYDRDGNEVRSVGLVGRRPDVIGGVVRDSVVVERAGRILLVGLADSTVRQFAVGHLLGVGGTHIVFTACSEEGTCTLNNAIIDDVMRMTPIDNYVDPTSGTVAGWVAPDGSGVVVHDYLRNGDVVARLGTRVVVGTGEALATYAWSPTTQWLFRVDETTKVLQAIDSFDGKVVTVPLPVADTVSLRGVAAW